MAYDNIKTAQAYLDAEGFSYSVETGSQSGSVWTALVYRYGATRADRSGLRIWSEDVESKIHIAFASARGGIPTGEAVTVNSTDPRMIRRVIGTMLDEVMDRVDGNA